MPTRSTLTAVATVDGQLWAGGHDGVILHSADGGQTWTAQRRDPYDRRRRRRRRDPRQGVPMLDILFRDASNGIAIGAYSLMLVTVDGGATWTPKQTSGRRRSRRAVAPRAAARADGEATTASATKTCELEDEADPHFNAIARTGAGSLVIVGERGTLLRSRDDGATWRALAPARTRVRCSACSRWAAQHILAFGLRGNVVRVDATSAPRWSKVETGTAAQPDGRRARWPAAVRCWSAPTAPC